MNYILYYLFSILIIFIFAYINSMHEIDEKKEGFTPKIRETYRPYVRNLRIGTQSLYNKYKTNVTNFLRKVGII